MQYGIATITKTLENQIEGKYEMYGIYFNLQECKKLARLLLAKGAYSVTIYDVSRPTRKLILNSSPKKWWDNRNCPTTWHK